MSGTDEPANTSKVPEDPARSYLESELGRCLAALGDAGYGQMEMVRGSRSFTGLWTAAIQNAARIHGRGAVGEALTKMGRSEDKAKMY